MSAQGSHSICFLGLPTITEWIHSEGFGRTRRPLIVLAREFATRDYDVTVVSPKPTPTTFQQHDIDHIGIPSNADLTKDPLERGSAYLDALRKTDSDVYYVHGQSGFLPLIWKYTQLTDAEYIFHMTDVSVYPDQNDSRLGEVRDIFDTAIDDATTLVAQTQKHQEALQSQYGREATVLWDCYDLPAKETLTSPGERKYFLWVNRLQPSQKPMRFLDLADQHPDLQFRMYGPIEDTNEFHNEVKERAQATENVNFVGFVPVDELPALYSEALAVVSTAERMGFPAPLVQAWAYGTPTLSRHNAVGQIPYRGDAHTSTGSFEELNTMITRFSERMPLVDRYESTRQTVKSHYAPDTLMPDYEDQIQQSLSK